MSFCLFVRVILQLSALSLYNVAILKLIYSQVMALLELEILYVVVTNFSTVQSVLVGLSKNHLLTFCLSSNI